jgi:hypothetical protein
MDLLDNPLDCEQVYWAKSVNWRHLRWPFYKLNGSNCIYSIFYLLRMIYHITSGLFEIF